MLCFHCGSTGSLLILGITGLRGLRNLMLAGGLSFRSLGLIFGTCMNELELILCSILLA